MLGGLERLHVDHVTPTRRSTQDLRPLSRRLALALYAGLLVLPFMITLAITGGLYLFKDELDALIHADVKRVAVQEATLPPSTLVSAALTAHPGTAVKFTDPATPKSSAEITVNTARASG